MRLINLHSAYGNTEFWINPDMIVFVQEMDNGVEIRMINKELYKAKESINDIQIKLIGFDIGSDITWKPGAFGYLNSDPYNHDITLTTNKKDSE